MKTISNKLADIYELRTTGGNGGTITTVSTLAQFTAAANNAKNNDVTPRIIVVSGTITGATQVRIGSNKTILGLPGASKFSSNPADFPLITN
jgi:pectate lyase